MQQQCVYVKRSPKQETTTPRKVIKFSDCQLGVTNGTLPSSLGKPRRWQPPWTLRWLGYSKKIKGKNSLPRWEANNQRLQKKTTLQSFPHHQKRISSSRARCGAFVVFSSNVKKWLGRVPSYHHLPFFLSVVRWHKPVNNKKKSTTSSEYTASFKTRRGFHMGTSSIHTDESIKINDKII